jgi:putative exosortase-associated protein (TIGR04073 family)
MKAACRKESIDMAWFGRQSGVKVMVAAALVAALGIIPAVAPAAGPLYRSTYPSKVTNKLGRGLGNFFFCWVEIPIEINREVQNTDLVTGSLTGLGRGFWFTGKRLVLGVVDVFTCPFDIYDNNYQSIQRSEFPFMDEVE